MLLATEVIFSIKNYSEFLSIKSIQRLLYMTPQQCLEDGRWGSWRDGQKVNFSDECDSVPQFINFVKENLGSGNHGTCSSKRRSILTSAKNCLEVTPALGGGETFPNDNCDHKPHARYGYLVSLRAARDTWWTDMYRQRTTFSHARKIYQVCRTESWMLGMYTN